MTCTEREIERYCEGERERGREWERERERERGRRHADLHAQRSGGEAQPRRYLEKKALLREGLRKRLQRATSAIEATTTLARDLAVGYDSDTLFEQDTRGYTY